MPQKQDLTVILRALHDARDAGLHVSLPCQVQSYDATRQVADLQPLLQQITADSETGEQLAESLPVLPNVPIAFPRAGSFFMSWPLAAGDFVNVVFADRPIGQLRATGAESDPGDLSTHTLDGGVGYPGFWPDGQQLNEASATGLVFGVDGGVQYRVTADGFLEAGTAAGMLDFVALAQKVLTELTNLQTHFAVVEGVISGAPIPEPGNGAPSALQTALAAAIGSSPYPSPGDVSAATLKAE